MKQYCRYCVNAYLQGDGMICASQKTKFELTVR